MIVVSVLFCKKGDHSCSDGSDGCFPWVGDIAVCLYLDQRLWTQPKLSAIFAEPCTGFLMVCT